MDRETRKNHPDEVFRIQFDEGEKGKGKEAGSSVEDFHSHRFLRRLIVPFTRTERSRVWYLKMSGVSFSPFFLSFSRMSLGLRMTHTRSLIFRSILSIIPLRDSPKRFEQYDRLIGSRTRVLIYAAEY